MKIPIPRPCQPKNSSGTAIRRIRTKIVESDPSAITTRLSGTVAGSSMPASRSATSAITASPMKKTSLPSVPVCQPMTAIVGPTDPDPAYQSVKAETLSTRPATHVARSPAAVMPPAIALARLKGLALKLQPPRPWDRQLPREKYVHLLCPHRSEPEQPLHLMPHRDAQVDAEREQRDDDQPETDVRRPPLARPLQARLALGSLTHVFATDRPGVVDGDVRRLLPRGLRHPRESKRLACWRASILRFGGR